MSGGFSHSEISGSMLVCQLPAAFRRLPRPSSPVIAKASTSCTFSLDPITVRPRQTNEQPQVLALRLHASPSPFVRSRTRRYSHLTQSIGPHANPKGIASPLEPSHVPIALLLPVLLKNSRTTTDFRCQMTDVREVARRDAPHRSF